MRAVVVIPTYLEADAIGSLVRALPAWPVLVVDDASPDGTADRARAAGAEVLLRNGPRGFARSCREGFAVAVDRADVVVQMDADGSHDPEDVPRLIAALEQADLALGSRYVAGGGTRNWNLGRRILSRAGSRYARACLGLPFRDLTGGFKAWRSDLLRRVMEVPARCDGYAFQVETTHAAHQLGARIVEVPILFTERRTGQSKMRTAIAVEAAWKIPALRW